MRRFGSRRKKPQAILDISLTPLIDTALTLLIIFMIATPMIQNAIRVNLPKGKAKEDNGLQQELVVYIDKESSIFFEGKKVEQARLVDELKKHLEQQQERTVYVKADQVVSYGCVIELVDHLKTVGGIRYVALATQKQA